MNTCELKNELRKKNIILRKQINNKELKSTKIVHKILDLEIYQKSKVICLYNAMSNEVNLNNLIKISLNLGKKVLLPRVYHELIFLEISWNTIYEKSLLGIMEPVYSKKDIYDGEIDLIIVPGVAFDNQNNRLGYGKGYYDAFLKNKSVFKIGVCFSEQIVDKIPYDNNDIKMDLIIKE